MGEQSLKQQAYNIIKGNIVNCAYLPGVMLYEEQLRRELNVSRTPIRDALGRLEQEGLIHILPKIGVMVAPLSVERINQLFEARVQLETYAIRVYGDRQADDVYIEYYRQFAEGAQSRAPEEQHRLDDRFHRGFIDATGNHFMMMSYDVLTSENTRFRVMSGSGLDGRMLNSCQEHLEIARYCVSREWAEAADAMREHLARSKRSILSVLLNERNA